MLLQMALSETKLQSIYKARKSGGVPPRQFLQNKIAFYASFDLLAEHLKEFSELTSFFFTGIAAIHHHLITS